MKDVPQLLPCPFCGSPARRHRYHSDPNRIFYGCSGDRGLCPGQSTFEATEELQAIAAWNTRVAASASNWIPVTETMPEIGVPVIVHGILEGEHEHDRHEAFRRHIGPASPWRSPRTENDENLRLREVTHWMPMPPAPI